MPQNKKQENQNQHQLNKKNHKRKRLEKSRKKRLQRKRLKKMLQEKRLEKRRNPVAKALLSLPELKQQVVKNKKLYKRVKLKLQTLPE